MGRIKDLNSSLPGETDNLVFDGLNGTKRISYADFKQKLIDDGFGSGSSEAVVLTQAEYNALPDEVKDSDTIFFISDAPFDLPNVVTLTRAEYDALSTADKMDGRFYYVTDDAEVATSLVVQTNQNNPDTVPSSAVLYAETNKHYKYANLRSVSSGSINAGSYYQHTATADGMYVMRDMYTTENIDTSVATGVPNVIVAVNGKNVWNTQAFVGKGVRTGGFTIPVVSGDVIKISVQNKNLTSYNLGFVPLE